MIIINDEIARPGEFSPVVVEELVSPVGVTTTVNVLEARRNVSVDIERVNINVADGEEHSFIAPEKELK